MKGQNLQWSLLRDGGYANSLILEISMSGLRAKDPGDSANKAFNATIKTEFDNNV
jgi:hypothetical protein